MNQLLAMTMRGQVETINGIVVRYDGAYDWVVGDEARSYTILSHFIDRNGQDRFKGTFGISGLRDLGVL